MPAEIPADFADEGEHEPAPWHFKLLLVAFVLYLIYRAVQILIWLVT